MTGEVDPNVGKEFLQHFGKKGMRWGVRKARSSDSDGKDEGKKKSSSSGPKKVVGKTNTEGKRPSTLSDAQLQKVVSRINLEQQYSRLTAPPPTRTQRMLKSTAKFGMEAGRSIAMQQIKAIGNEQASKKIAVLMKAQSLKGVPIAPNRMANILPDIATRVG